MTKLPVAINVQSNWRVPPEDSDDENLVIRPAEKILRAAHPYVAG